MTKQELIDMLEDNFTTDQVRDLVRHLKDQFEYDFRTTATKEELLDQLEVTKKGTSSKPYMMFFPTGTKGVIFRNGALFSSFGSAGAFFNKPGANTLGQVFKAQQTLSLFLFG